MRCICSSDLGMTVLGRGDPSCCALTAEGAMLSAETEVRRAKLKVGGMSGALAIVDEVVVEAAAEEGGKLIGGAGIAEAQDSGDKEASMGTRLEEDEEAAEANGSVLKTEARCVGEAIAGATRPKSRSLGPREARLLE